MTLGPNLPDWAALLTALFVLLGAGWTLTGSLGLLRLGRFYERVHAPTLGATLGAACVLIASMICFSALQTRPVVHEILIAIFVTLTTPVTLMLLVRAALFRDRAEGNVRDLAWFRDRAEGNERDVAWPASSGDSGARPTGEGPNS